MQEQSREGVVRRAQSEHRISTGAVRPISEPAQVRTARAELVKLALVGIALVLSLVASGCMVGPDPKTPVMQVPEGWTSPLVPPELPTSIPSATTAPTTATAPVVTLSTANTRRLDPMSWWRLFNDPELNWLIDQAMKTNLDVKVALAQIVQARALRTGIASGLFPTASANGSYSRTFAAPTQSKPADTFAAGFDAAWEIDVFGGQRRAVQAADEATDVSINNRRDVLITVVAEVAADYIQLRGFQGQIAIARRNLISQQKTADLTRRRQRGGFQTGLDVANADADVASTLSTIPVLEQSAQQTIYALSVLLGTPPATLKNELIASAPIPIIPPEVPIGLPSELLRRRPDIRRAEFQLRAQTAQVGVAVSNLYPKFSLTGTGGFQGGHFSALGNWKDRFWSFGPSIDWPILDFGAIRANIRVQTALEEQNFYLYQKTVLVALEDVESALIAYTEEQQHHAALQAAVAANSKAVDLSTLLYSTGQTDFLNVLTAQRLLFSAETALVQSDTTLATNLVALYKALGGGWEGTDIPSEKTVPPVAPTLNVPIDSTPDRKMN